MTQMRRFSDPIPEGETNPLAYNDDPIAVAAYEDTLTLLRLRAAAKDARKKEHLRQEDVAVQMGTKQSAISDLESGRVDAQLSTWQRYARAVGRRFAFSLERPHPPTRISVAALALSPVLTELSRAATARTVDTISDKTRLPAPLVTSILTGLRQKGWALSRSSREGDSYTLVDGAANLIGLSLHGDRIIGTLIDMKGRLQTDAQKLPLSSSTPETVVADATELVRHLYDISYRQGKPVLGVGACLAGFVDADNGRVTYAPDLQCEDNSWVDVDLEILLQERIRHQIDMKLHAVVFNDANALALSHYQGRGFAPRTAADVDDYDATSAALILITGAGIGSGIIANGKLLTGTHSRAGEIGHVIVERGADARRCRISLNHSGCLETLASPQGILRSLPLPSGTSAERKESLERANIKIADGNKEYRNIFVAAGMRFGAALLSIGILNPKDVAIYCTPALHEQTYATARAFQEGVEMSLHHADDRQLISHDYNPELKWLSLKEDTLARSAGVAMLVSEFLQRADEWYPGLGENDGEVELELLDSDESTLQQDSVLALQ